MGVYETMLRACCEQVVNLTPPGDVGNLSSVEALCRKLTAVAMMDHITTAVLDFEQIVSVNIAWWIYGLLFAVELSLTVLLNVFSIYIFLDVSMRSPTTYLLAAITALDLLTCLCQTPLNIHAYLLEGYRELPSYAWCQIYNYVHNFLPSALHSVAFLLNMFLSVQRCVGVRDIKQLRVFSTYKAALLATLVCTVLSFSIHSLYPVTIGIERVAAISKKVISASGYHYIQSCRVVPRYKDTYISLYSSYLWLRVSLLQVIPALIITVCNITLVQTSYRTYAYRRRLVGELGVIVESSPSSLATDDTFLSSDGSCSKTSTAGISTVSGPSMAEYQSQAVAQVIYTRPLTITDVVSQSRERQRSVDNSVNRCTRERQRSADYSVNRCTRERQRTVDNSVNRYARERQRSVDSSVNRYTRERQRSVYNSVDRGNRERRSGSEGCCLDAGAHDRRTNKRFSTGNIAWFSRKGKVAPVTSFSEILEEMASDRIIHPGCRAQNRHFSICTLPMGARCLSRDTTNIPYGCHEPVLGRYQELKCEPRFKNTNLFAVDCDTFPVQKESGNAYFEQSRRTSGCVVPCKNADNVEVMRTSFSHFGQDESRRSVGSSQQDRIFNKQNGSVASRTETNHFSPVIANSKRSQCGNICTPSGHGLPKPSFQMRNCSHSRPRSIAHSYINNRFKPLLSTQHSITSISAEVRSSIMLILVTSCTLVAEVFVIILLILLFLNNFIWPNGEYLRHSDLSTAIMISNAIVTMTFPLNFVFFCGLSQAFRAALTIRLRALIGRRSRT